MIKINIFTSFFVDAIKATVFYNSYFVQVSKNIMYIKREHFLYLSSDYKQKFRIQKNLRSLLLSLILMIIFDELHFRIQNYFLDLIT